MNAMGQSILSQMTPPMPNSMITESCVCSTHQVFAIDQSGKRQEVSVVGEVPLRLKVDGFEIVRLMTLGNQPEVLALGYLRNQGFIEKIEEIASVAVDWENETVNVATRRAVGINHHRAQPAIPTVTSACGQGTLFDRTSDALYTCRFPKIRIRQSILYSLLKEITQYNQIYRKAGTVHGCGLCRESELLMFVEDVGRHNAADTIAGRMWIEDIRGEDKILYTTGRLTSEIVLKTAQMRIPVLLSRSGITFLALEIARDLGLTVIGRAKGMRHLIYNGTENIIFDALKKDTQN
jgi:FdhD protein